ncbi:MAG: hypothetical protein COZ06_05900 [Armatimonadetes bacterium CG_4_10_14_3_um_filter_66_18]|nr:hypothetical protein [Armatimonadota bacterium]OIO94234.1 MAG: hypothetical protein AUJ96_29050 [Armatimonadetes bacterium CG2_30_66_41]PIU94464.1 MAG: hypothetical protein COS65_07565 [Armatimonadetes bacterium CG06_land_8_20_14_3_00_66_21]PIX37404.1 MAG: hypothetical protein COZ57_34520 [Armatimonadetes bacterium CG_4_8_14_3_um_filter_66_20]PIY51106.1 MAG: hypothetical protein COZ06_05900 [Armatimonadetes bacterium CG_4_10_14_3_um_filter_66_18]PIZ50468.1 MAG: hypothetical protein COY42_01
MPEVTHVHIVESEEDGARLVANLVQEVVDSNPAARLDTATGGTMEPVCRQLASRYAEGLLSLAGVETFQLDEYYPIDPWHLQSYRVFIRKHLVEVTDLPLASAHVLRRPPEGF